MNGQRAGGIALLLLGVAFGLLAIVFAVQKVPLNLSGVPTTGTVVSVDASSRPSRRYGMIQFRDRSGTIRTTPTVSPGHEVGDVVEIIYLPSHPAKASEYSFATAWGALIALPLLSGFLIRGGTRILRKPGGGARRRR